jgi:hypothetical protein
MPTKICYFPQWEKIRRSATGNQQGVEMGEGEEDGYISDCGVWIETAKDEEGVCQEKSASELRV